MTRHSEQRRPHWTPELVEAVRHASRTRILNDEQTFAVIAAVEDWQATSLPSGVAVWEYAPKGTLSALQAANEQIQAVREVLMGEHPIPRDISITYTPMGAFVAGVQATTKRVRRALDGGDDD